jgi:hypothetical protein
MAGAVARAAAQGTIHPLDTLKVQMQIGRNAACQTGGNLRHAGRGSTSGVAVRVGGSRGGAAAIATVQVSAARHPIITIVYTPRCLSSVCALRSPGIN